MGPKGGDITGAEEVSRRAGPWEGLRESLGADRVYNQAESEETLWGLPPIHSAIEELTHRFREKLPEQTWRALGLKVVPTGASQARVPLGPGWERRVPLEHLCTPASNRRRRKWSLLPVSAWVPSLQGPVGQQLSGTEAGRRYGAHQAERTQAAEAAARQRLHQWRRDRRRERSAI